LAKTPGAGRGSYAHNLANQLISAIGTGRWGHRSDLVIESLPGRGTLAGLLATLRLVGFLFYDK
jgi:hypothetical protein